VLSETTYLLKQRIGIRSVIKCLEGLISAKLPPQSLSHDDLGRVQEITAT
jgi:hypothetical protein